MDKDGRSAAASGVRYCFCAGIGAWASNSCRCLIEGDRFSSASLGPASSASAFCCSDKGGGGLHRGGDPASTSPLGPASLGPAALSAAWLGLGLGSGLGLGLG